MRIWKTIILGIISLLVICLILVVFLYTPDIPITTLKSKYTNSASKFIDVDGISVHYRQEGTGPDLLLIHGTASSLHTWDGWVDALKSDFRITRLDLPAFGLTGPHPDRNYSIDFYTEFLDEFVQSVGLDTFYLAGNSLGGGIAWSYTIKHEEKVKKLVLVDASGYPKEGIPAVFKIAKNPVGAALLKRVTPRFFVAENVNDVYFDDSKISEELIDRYYELTLRPGNRQAFIDRARNVMQYDQNNIKKISKPTLIQWGTHDTWIPVSDAYNFHQDISYSELIIYESGHVPMEENPLITAIDCRNFLLSK